MVLGLQYCQENNENICEEVSTRMGHKSFIINGTITITVRTKKSLKILFSGTRPILFLHVAIDLCAERIL